MIGDESDLCIFDPGMGDDSKYIYRLIEQGEHQQQDFKFEITSARKIARSLVAFSNTDGGRLLIGVKDNGRVTGIRSEEEFYMIEAAAGLYCRPEVPFKCNNRLVEGKTVLEVIIESSEQMPHYAQLEDGRWKAFHRVKDENLLADYILLQVWKRGKRKRGTYFEYSENEEAVLKFIEDNGPVDFLSLKENIKLNRKELQQILINLIALETVKMEFEKDLVEYAIVEPE